MKIFDAIDPRIKKILEKVTEIKFENSKNLSKMKKNSSKNNIGNFAELDYSENSIESPMFRRMKVSTAQNRRKQSSSKTSGRKKEGEGRGEN